MSKILFFLLLAFHQICAKNVLNNPHQDNNVVSNESGYNVSEVVAFTAELSQDVDLTGGNVILFDKVVTNEGGRYFGTSGQFACTDDDLYMFAWSARHAEDLDNEGMRVIMKLRKGGSDYKYGPKSNYYIPNMGGVTQMTATLQCSTDIPTAITVMTVPWSEEVGSTTRYRSAGYTSFSGVKLQSQVAFTAELSEDQILFDGSRLRFKRIVSNFGEHYDPINHFFRCPDDGLYVFSVTTYTPNPSSPWSVSRLMMDDEVVLQGPITYIATESYDSGSSSITAVLQCTQDFSVYVEAQASHDFFHNSYGAELTSFTGFKLYDVISGAVAFTAVMTTNQTITSAGQPLAFDGLITNIGNAFDVSFSQFVCPDDDIYLFTMSLTVAKGYDHSHGDLYMDGTRVRYHAQTRHHENGTSGTSSTTFITRCKVGSTFQVLAREAATQDRVFLEGFCSFSGYKVPGAW